MCRPLTSELTVSFQGNPVHRPVVALTSADYFCLSFLWGTKPCSCSKITFSFFFFLLELPTFNNHSVEGTGYCGGRTRTGSNQNSLWTAKLAIYLHLYCNKSLHSEAACLQLRGKSQMTAAPGVPLCHCMYIDCWAVAWGEAVILQYLMGAFFLF